MLTYMCTVLIKPCELRLVYLHVRFVCTHASILLQLELMVKFAAYVPECVASSIEAVYFFNPNLAFKQSAAKLASTMRIFSHIKVS